MNDWLHQAEAAEWARGDWMQTWTGARFYPADPRREDIDPIDIAHALSMLCRYAGHLSQFYSVAEHSVLMSEWVGTAVASTGDPRWAEFALAALLHDATEAYVVDVPRPLKRMLPDYQRVEAAVWRAICGRFGLDLTVPGVVKEADARILLTERDVLMPNTRYSWSQDGLVPLPVLITGWAPPQAEMRFTKRLMELTGPR